MLLRVPVSAWFNTYRLVCVGGLIACVCCRAECAAAWIHPGLELVHLEGMGRTLRATQDMARGTLILREAPLITTLPMDAVPEDLQMKYQEVGFPRVCGFCQCVSCAMISIYARCEREQQPLVLWVHFR